MIVLACLKVVRGTFMVMGIPKNDFLILTEPISVKSKAPLSETFF